jgi:hypothetical protein
MGCGMVKFGKMHHIHPVFKAKDKTNRAITMPEKYLQNQIM